MFQIFPESIRKFSEKLHENRNSGQAIAFLVVGLVACLADVTIVLMPQRFKVSENETVVINSYGNFTTVLDDLDDGYNLEVSNVSTHFIFNDMCFFHTCAYLTYYVIITYNVLISQLCVFFYLVTCLFTYVLISHM